MKIEPAVTMVMLRVNILILLPAMVYLREGNNEISNIHGKKYTQEQLYCNDKKQSIALEEVENDGRMILGKSTGASCQNGSIKCRKGNDDIIRNADVTELKYVYDTCSNRPTCNVTAPSNDDALKYHYINYKYSCLSRASNYDMSKDFNITVNEYFYLYLNTSSSPASRVCSISSSLPLQVYSMYITLSFQSRQKISIFSANQTLFDIDQIDEDAAMNDVDWIREMSLLIFSEKLNMTVQEINITIDDLMMTPGEHLWLKFKSEDDKIRASCHEYIKPTTTPDVITEVYNRTSPSVIVRGHMGYWIYIGTGMGVICVLLVFIIICALCGRNCDEVKENSKSNAVNPMARPTPIPPTNNEKQKETTLNPTYCDPIDFLTPKAASQLKNARRPNPSPEYQTISEILGERLSGRGSEYKNISGSDLTSDSGSDVKNDSAIDTRRGSEYKNISGSDLTSDSGSAIDTRMGNGRNRSPPTSTVV